MIQLFTFPQPLEQHQELCCQAIYFNKLSKYSFSHTQCHPWKNLHFGNQQRASKYVPRAASGLLQLKALTQSCCPQKEARASPQFTPPKPQPCSHTLCLTAGN